MSDPYPPLDALIPEVREFCRRLVPDREPVWVPVRPAHGLAGSNPFGRAKAQAAGHGGRVVYGWTLREYPGWYLEAEFHAVWAAPDGSLVDVTLRADRAPAILFQPDPHRTYRGEAVPNRFMALSASPDVVSVVQNAEMHARLRADAETLARRERVQAGPGAGRNDLCPCGSGLKYKKCCGHAH